MLEALLGRAGGGQITGLDCGEYPCVAVVSFAGSDPEERAAGFSDAFAQSPLGVAPYISEARHRAGESQVHSIRVAMPFDDASKQHPKRLAFRLSEIGEAYAVDEQALLDDAQ